MQKQCSAYAVHVYEQIEPKQPAVVLRMKPAGMTCLAWRVCRLKPELDAVTRYVLQLLAIVLYSYQVLHATDQQCCAVMRCTMLAAQAASNLLRDLSFLRNIQAIAWRKSEMPKLENARIGRTPELTDASSVKSSVPDSSGLDSCIAHWLDVTGSNVVSVTEHPKSERISSVVTIRDWYEIFAWAAATEAEGGSAATPMQLKEPLQGYASAEEATWNCIQ